MRFLLRYGQHDIELKPGRFVIGRAETCQLALDDPMVSRHHAVLLVEADRVTVEDLGSRNGVYVNDVRQSGRAALAPGDRVRLGSQELLLMTGAGPPPARAAPTVRVSAFGVVGTLADKALALGHADEAERVLSGPLDDVLSKAQGGQPLDAETSERAAAYATRLAGATGKAAWVDYTVRLYLALGRPFPSTIVDALHEVVRKVGEVDRATLRAYVELLRDRVDELGPSERFVVSRIEGLERVAAAR